MVYSERIVRFQELLGAHADIAFLPISADLQYLTGIPRDIPNFGAVLHPGAWLEGAWIAPKHAPVVALPRMTAEFGGLANIKNIQLRVLGDWDAPIEMVRDILRGFNLPPRPRVAIGDRTHGETVIGLQAVLPDAVFISATEILRTMRVIKSEDEIAIMRRAGEITETAFTEVLSHLKHGMTEYDIIAEVNYQLGRAGALGPSFTTSLYNSGPNHPLMFGDREESWKRSVNPPVSVLFDFGAVYDGYCYDYGRTVFFGAPPAEAQIVYNLVMASQAAGVAALRTSEVTAQTVDATARQIIVEGGYGDEFRHRLGHGIGMDVHEPPFLTNGDTTLLREGMLFTIEPSIMQFNSFSARVEDVVVVRREGGEKLTSGYQNLIVID